MHHKKLLILFIFFSAPIVAADSSQEDNAHVRNWNKFADDALALHKKIIADKEYRKETRVGGYFGIKDFYNEETFYDKANNKLISRVQWERENPEALHAIEVFVRDKEGRVIRDYAAAYLPTYRNAPTQTLISFHNYNGNLHAFRSFDASGYRIVERCQGTLKGKDVNFILDEDEIANALDGVSDIMKTEKYQACFNGLRDKLGEYRVPQ